MDQEMSVDKVGEIFKITWNNIAPGAGRFCSCFCKMFLKFIKFIITGAVNDVFVSREVPITLRLGIISWIPKGDTDHTFIRPLTLLNTQYKLIWVTSANGLKSTSDKILGKSQKSFVQGRYTAECNRNICLIMIKKVIRDYPDMLNKKFWRF